MILRRLLGFLRPYANRIAAGFALLVLDVALELAPGFVWMYIVDRVILAKNLEGLWPAVGTMVGIALVESQVSRARRLLMEGAAQAYVRDLRNRLVDKLTRLPLGYFSEARTGDLLSRVTSDVEAVQEVVINGTDTLLANFLRLAGVVTIFVYWHPILGLATVSPIFVVGVMIFFFNRKIKPLYRDARKQLGQVGAGLGDTLGGIRVVKSFARELGEAVRFQGLNQAFFETSQKAIKTRANLFPWVGFVVSFTNTIMLALGSFYILKGEFTLGGLVGYRTYGRFFYGPIDNLAQINDMLQRALAAGARIFEVLDAPEVVSDPEQPVVLSNVRGELAFEGVFFAYQGTQTHASPPALHDVSFLIAPGERVAVVGASGAGKSTLFSIVQRFYDPSDGRITVDGIDLRDVAQQDLRRQMVAVPQDTFLFATTVRENIRFGAPDATDAQVDEAARLANAMEFIERLPEGLDSLVGERGVKLSGGQRQRIAIARAFLVDSPILLLDEATSAVEPESEKAILKALDRLQSGRTTLIATHRLGTIREADRILVLERGRLVEQGRHEELVARNGVYARLTGEFVSDES